MRACVRMK